MDFPRKTHEEEGSFGGSPFDVAVQMMPTYWNFQIWCEKGLLTFRLTDNNVTVYEEGIPEAQVFEGIPPKSDYLKDLLREIEENTHELTGSVIASARTALSLQREVDS